MQSLCAKHREEGKEAFKAKQFNQAIACYTAALQDLANNCDVISHESESNVDAESSAAAVRDLTESASGCFANRAVCHVKLCDWQGAVQDAAAATSLILSQQTHSSPFPFPSPSSLSKPLYILAKALQQQAGLADTHSGDNSRVLYAESLAVLRFLALTDAHNKEAIALTALVTKKVDTLGGAGGDEESSVSVPPSRQRVSCSFAVPSLQPVPR